MLPPWSPGGTDEWRPGRRARRPSSRSAGAAARRTPSSAGSRATLPGSTIVPGCVDERRRASSRRRTAPGRASPRGRARRSSPAPCRSPRTAAPSARRGSSRTAGAARRTRMSTWSTSPGRAPATAIGPVSRCGPGPRSCTSAKTRSMPSSISRSGASPAWWVSASIAHEIARGDGQHRLERGVEVAPVHGLGRRRQLVERAPAARPPGTRASRRGR